MYSLGNHTDEQSVAADAKTAETTSRNVSTRQSRTMTQDSPIGLGTETAKRPGRYNHVSDEGNNMCVPRNTPIKTPGTQDREIVFGRGRGVGGRRETFGECKVGGRDGEQSGDMDGTISSGNVNSNRIEAAPLAAESQHTCNNAR